MGLRLPALAGAALAGLLVLACGGKNDDGGPEPPPLPPDLSGARVMIVPARPGEPAGLDAELTFWLTDRGGATEWIRPQEVEAAVERAPASGFRLEAPRVLRDMGDGDYRIQDPLYGDLRRLGAILDAGLALVPVGTRERVDSTGAHLELAAALVTVRGGRVVWRHTVSVDAGGEAGGVASAAAALARTLIPGDG